MRSLVAEGTLQCVSSASHIFHLRISFRLALHISHLIVFCSKSKYDSFAGWNERKRKLQNLLKNCFCLFFLSGETIFGKKHHLSFLIFYQIVFALYEVVVWSHQQLSSFHHCQIAELYSNLQAGKLQILWIQMQNAKFGLEM